MLLHDVFATQEADDLTQAVVGLRTVSGRAFSHRSPRTGEARSLPDSPGPADRGVSPGMGVDSRGLCIRAAGADRRVMSWRWLTVKDDRCIEGLGGCHRDRGLPRGR